MPDRVRPAAQMAPPTQLRTAPGAADNGNQRWFRRSGGARGILSQWQCRQLGWLPVRGEGGSGQYADICLPGSGAGGGGAGYYYGGGGGSGAGNSASGGGGGGSSYIDPSATTISQSVGAPVHDPVAVPAYTTTTTLSASPKTPIYGDSVTMTAHVTAVELNRPVPGGTVEFYAGTSLLGTGPVASTGDATFATTALPVGTNFSRRISSTRSTAPRRTVPAGLRALTRSS